VTVTEMKSIVTQALEDAVAGEKSRLDKLFTDDVVGWTPTLAVQSRAELAREFDEQHGALSNVAISFDAIYLVGDNAIAEWRIDGDHTGALEIGDEAVIEPTGRHIVLAGATFAQFRDDQICAFRSYFDDAALMEQLLVSA
jgi:ketosteroid isomerase-like protein